MHIASRGNYSILRLNGNRTVSSIINHNNVYITNKWKHHRNLSTIPTSISFNRHNNIQHHLQRNRISLNNMMKRSFGTERSLNALDVGEPTLTNLQIQLLAVLDIRLLNFNRHDSNFLVARNEEGVIDVAPIDAMWLPEKVNLSLVNWCWINWPQMKIPMEEEIIDYIGKIDLELDTEVLSGEIGVSEQCLNWIRISGCLLKQGAASGLTIHEIASCFIRHDNTNQSEIERCVNNAILLAKDEKYETPRSQNALSLMSNPGKNIFHSTPVNFDWLMHSSSLGGDNNDDNPLNTQQFHEQLSDQMILLISRIKKNRKNKNNTQ